MDASEELKTDLAALQAVVGRRNILFARRVRLDSKQDRILVITPSKLFFLVVKAPHKIDSSFHLLDVHGLESKKPLQMTIAIRGDKRVLLAVKVAHHEDIDQIAAHMLSQLKLNFPLSNVSKSVIININPTERQKRIESLCENFVNALLDTDIGPCGGFSLSYLCLCDYYGQHSLAEVVWDIDKIYGSHKCTVFDVADFDHLEQRELLPIVATLEYNTWFKKLRCKSLKLSSDVIDTIMKVMKVSQSLEGVTLKDIHLTRDHAQKFATALISNPDSALKEIDLSSNNLEDRGVNHLCGALASLNHGLESLQLSTIGVSNKGTLMLANALRTNKFISSTLTRLNISNNMLKSESAPVLCDFLANPNVLRKLDLSNTDCALDLLFGAMLRGCTQHLQHLNVSGNPFSYKRSKETQILPSLQQFFSSSLAIQFVNLSSTRIPPEAVKAILLGLLGNVVVPDVGFDFSKNELRSAGSHEISSCITNLKNVSHLDLTDNGIDYDIVNLCIALQKNSSVKHLAIGQNFVKTRNISPIMEAIVDLISQENGVLQSISLAESKLKHEALGFIDALGTNNSILEIDLRGNMIGDEGARLLAKALQINTTLRTVQLDRNTITHKGFEDIATALKRNYSLHCIPMPASDIALCMKHNGEATTKALSEIEKLLLRNQSPHRFNPEQSHRLQQSLLLSSIDQNNTDELVVSLQNLMATLRRSPDQIVTDELSNAQLAMKDADNLKEVLMNLYLNTDMPSKTVRSKLETIASDLEDFIDASLKSVMVDMLAKAEERCPQAINQSDLLQQLKSRMEEKASIDRVVIQDAVLRLAGTQIISNVCKSSLAAASLLGDELTELVVQNLNTSHVKLSLLEREQELQRRSSSANSNVRELLGADDEASKVARKAQNRLSKIQQRSSLLVAGDQGSSSKNPKRRPTFHRKPPAKGEVAVDINIDGEKDGHATQSEDRPSKSGRKAESVDPSWNIQVAPALKHLNKDRVRPARGRKPPSRPSKLAHLNPDASFPDAVDGAQSDASADERDGASTDGDISETSQEAPKSNTLPHTPSPKSLSPKPAPRPKPADKQRDSTKKHKNPLGGIGLPNFLKKKGRSSSMQKEDTEADTIVHVDVVIAEKPPEASKPEARAVAHPEKLPADGESADTAAVEAEAKDKEQVEESTPQPTNDASDAAQGNESAAPLSLPSSELAAKRPTPAKRPAGSPMAGAVGFGGGIMQEMKLRQNKEKGSPTDATDRPSPSAKPVVRERKDLPMKPSPPKKPPSVKQQSAPDNESKAEKRMSLPDIAAPSSTAPDISSSDNATAESPTPRSSSVGTKEHLGPKARARSHSSGSNAELQSNVLTALPHDSSEKTIDEELTDALFPDEDPPSLELDEEEQLNMKIANMSSTKE